MKYKCPRCGYEATKLNHYETHIVRKNICKPIVNNVIPNLDNVIREYYICQHCSVEYADSTSFKGHVEICEQNSLKKELNALKKEFKEFKEMTLAKTNATNATNIHNGNVHNGDNISNVHNGDNIFVINNFINTEFNLTDNDVRHSLRQRENAVTSLIEKIHFNVSNPKNHNLYVTNYKTNKALVKKGDKWISVDGNEIVDDMIVDYHNKVFHPWSEKEERCYDDKNIYDNYLSATSSPESEKKMKKNVLHTMYIKKDIVMESKEKETNKMS
jgi:hypothetical protein